MSTPSPSAPSAAAVAERVNQLSQQIALQESAINRSARLTTTIGVIALVALSIYFYVGYNFVGELLEPKMLVPYGAQMLNNRLPEARKELVKQIAQSAPKWAKEASVQVREQIPGLRVKLENYVLSNTDDLLGKVTNITEDHFRKAIKDNRELLENGFKELASSDKLTEETLNALVAALEQELQADMKAQAEIVLETLHYLSERVQRLSKGSNLDQQERYMRLIAMIARRMRDQTADETPIQIPSVEDSQPVKSVTASDKPMEAAGGGGDNAASKEDKSDAKDDKSDAKKSDDAK